MNVEVSITGGNGKIVSCVLPNLLQASGVVTSLAAKGHGVHVVKTKEPVTHKNSYAAQACLEVGQMCLDY